MAGAIIENLSGKKLSVLVAVLLSLQLACFLIGGLIAPAPSQPEQYLATTCADDGTKKMHYNRGRGSCKVIPDIHHFSLEGSEQNPSNIIKAPQNEVFVFQIPFIREHVQLDFSRWQQNLIGLLSFDINYVENIEMADDVQLTLVVSIAYRNKGDADEDWKLISKSTVQRHIFCSISEKKEGHPYECSIVPLFELGSLYHDYYLLNVKIIPREESMSFILSKLVGIWLITIVPTGGFTMIWLILKTLFLPLVIMTMIWFWKRVKQLKRQPVLLEYMLISLGASLTFLNTPFEFLTLYYDLPFMPLLQDIRQGVFYASLLSFWLVFAGEHLMIQDPQPHHLRMYWKHLSAVAIGCISLFIFDVFEKGSQVANPFYSVWASHLGTNLALSFIICAGISGSIYFIFLCYMIYRVMNNISVKRTALPSMCSVRRLHYEGIIYRFKFLMMATLICAAMTIIGFLMDEATEERWVWNAHIEIEYTSAFLTGTYGMWNIYILALIILYSPSHKQWPSEMDLNVPVNDEIELSHISSNEPNEISLLTSFVKKTTTD